MMFMLNQCTKDFEGEYSDPDKMEIIDEQWNETDAKLTGKKLINSMLSRPWINFFGKENKGKRPIVMVLDVENKSHEHIDTEAITDSIRYEILNSGAVRFVNAKARDKILKEMNYQADSGMVSAASAKKKGRQIGADFILTGGISSQVHENKSGNLQTVSYKTNLRLTSLESSEIVWEGEHIIKKKFKKNKAGW